MNSSRLRLIGISKTFQEGRPNSFSALKDIDLDIDLHRFVVFKGPSGSGKTTLLSLIGCMNRPTTGRIWFRDTEVTGLPEKFLTQIRRQHFGFVFQDFRLLPNLNVLENVMLPAWPCRQTGGEIRNRASQLLDRLGMSVKALNRPKDLSGGEKQRIAIARALINDPDLLIADEPTAHLDTNLSVEILHIFRSLRLHGKGVLVASHDPLITSASSIEHLFELKDGTIMQGKTGQC
jgi:putative ABC transport system ATP-binding protein